MGLLAKFVDGGTPRLPPRQPEDQTSSSSASILSGKTEVAQPVKGSARNDERVHRAMLYLNTATPKEREDMRRKEAERVAREGDKP
jgi:hypothetical protein